MCVGPLTAQAAVLSGKIAFEGEAPAPKPINFGAEKQCAMMHGDKMPTNEDLIVNPNQTVKWALVYVKEGAPASTAPTEALEIDQKECMFAPHAAVARVGQKVIFKNSDAVLHNVRSESKINKPFNIAQPIQGMTTAKTFAQSEVGIKIRCDVHFWMASFVHVFDHCRYEFKTLRRGQKFLSALAGPTCDSFDTLSLNEEIPELYVDDVVYVKNIGAYSCASATANFNGFPPAKIIFI